MAANIHGPPPFSTLVISDGAGPSSYLVVRFPIGKYLSVCVFLWACVLMCHAACNNFAGLMVARFFLGVGEAAVAPGFSLHHRHVLQTQRATIPSRVVVHW